MTNGHDRGMEVLAARFAEQDRQHDETLRAMSDNAIRHQLAHGAQGGLQRLAIMREAARRQVQA